MLMDTVGLAEKVVIKTPPTNAVSAARALLWEKS
jgi:hypothetical protein